MNISFSISESRQILLTACNVVDVIRSTMILSEYEVGGKETLKLTFLI